MGEVHLGPGCRDRTRPEFCPRDLTHGTARGGGRGRAPGPERCLLDRRQALHSRAAVGAGLGRPPGLGHDAHGLACRTRSGH